MVGRREIQDRLAELSWWRRNRSLLLLVIISIDEGGEPGRSTEVVSRL